MSSPGIRGGGGPWRQSCFVIGPMLARAQTDPTVVAALSDVLNAGRQLLIDRVELVLLDWRQSFERVAITAALLVLGGLLLFGALYGAEVALIEVISRHASHSTALLSCAAWNGALGGGLIFAGIRLRR